MTVFKFVVELKVLGEFLLFSFDFISVWLCFVRSRVLSFML